jgi:D-alanyl-D-alanine carboxypeptidase (penicillin-binding protein 5/6)
MPLLRIAAAILLPMAAVPAVAALPDYSSAAPIAYMIDLKSGATLYAKSAGKRVPPASMTKMMTTHIAFDLITQGKLRLDQKFKVRPATFAKWSGPKAGSTMFLKAGEQVSVENLLNGVVTLSGNDAAVTLAEGIAGTESAFVAKMNEKAKALGMANSQFGTATGWPDGGKTYSTAQDLSMLGVSTLRKYPDLYRKFYGRSQFSWGKQSNGNDITQANRNPILGKIVGADGIKTGHTEEAGYCFTGSAEQKGRRLVMVVAGLPSFDSRIAESVRFMSWGFSAWMAKPLYPAGKPIGSAQVQQGSQSEVALVTPSEVAVTVPASDGNMPFTTTIAYKGPIKAPIRKGQEIATLVVRVEGMVPQITPLMAAENVGEAGFMRRAWLGLMTVVGA